MRIGIDASRAFVDEPTGTERYSYELITRMVRLPEAKEHEWVLYTRNLAFGSEHLAFNSPMAQFRKLIDQMPNVKMIHVGLPKLWTQVGLAARTWLDGLDVLWVPAHTLPVLRKPGMQTVVTIHGIEYEWLPAYENRLQRWYLPLSTQYAVATATRVIAVSQFTKDQLVQRLGARGVSIKVVHEGFSNAPSDPPLNLRGGRQGELLKKYALKSKQYILFVGTVQPRKNLERLVEAYLTLVTPPNPPLNLRGGNLSGQVKLVIAGKRGWGCETLFRKFEILNSNDQVNSKSKTQNPKQHNIILTGYITDEERQVLLNNALFYIQPSITEGFGLPVLEAWAAGLAVASSRGGALRELLTKSEILNSNDQTNQKSKIKNQNKKLEIAGILFDPYSVEEMAQAMKQLTEDATLRAELARRGRERLQDFSWDKAAAETFQILTNPRV